MKKALLLLFLSSLSLMAWAQYDPDDQYPYYVTLTTGDTVFSKVLEINRLQILNEDHVYVDGKQIPISYVVRIQTPSGHFAFLPIREGTKWSEEIYFMRRVLEGELELFIKDDFDLFLSAVQALNYVLNEEYYLWDASIERLRPVRKRACIQMLASEPDLQASYRKIINQRRAGWILFGAGIPLAAAGFFGGRNSLNGDILWIPGAAASALGLGFVIHVREKKVVPIIQEFNARKRTSSNN